MPTGGGVRNQALTVIVAQVFNCRKILQIKTRLQEQSTDSLEIFGRRLRGAAEDRRLSQAQIAETLGIKPSRVGNWFQGRNLPRGKNLLELAKLLDLPPDFLVNGEEDANRRSVHEEQAPPGTSRARPIIARRGSDLGSLMRNQLRRGINQSIERLLEAAGNDPVRLAWIREQMRAHLTPPAHWQEEQLGSAAERAIAEGERAAASYPPGEHPAVKQAFLDAHAAEQVPVVETPRRKGARAK